MNTEIQRLLIDYLPIWAVYLVTIGACLLAEEAGFRFGSYWHRKRPDEDRSNIGTMLGSTLGLWAFLLAFLVGMSTNRYEERRSLIINEANSIGTTYLRAGLLPDPFAEQSRKLLGEYTGTRVRMNEIEGFLEAVTSAEGFHAQLWSVAEEMAKTVPANPIYSTYINSLNETIDAHAVWVAAMTISRVPNTIYLSMYIVAALALFMLGFNNGITGKRAWIVSLALILVFSTIMILVVDLDRPWGGLLKVNLQPMIDLVNSFASYR